MRLRILIILTAFLISGCSGLNLFEPTPTSTPLPTATIEPTKTAIPTPTISPTPDLLAEYTSMLFPIPSGFEWKVVPDLKLAIVIPDGWYFKRDPRTNLGFAGGIYVTKENIDEVGRFSTGQSVFMYPNIEDDPESFATGVLYDLATSETTTKILDSWDYKTDTYVIHHLRVEAYIPYETEVNKNKTIQYSTSVFNNAVYLSVFESPTADWDQVLMDYGIMLDYLSIFSDEIE